MRLATSSTVNSGSRSSARVAARSLGPSLRGRPPFRPLARAASSPALVRSAMISRSNSAVCGAPHTAEYAERAIMRFDLA